MIEIKSKNNKLIKEIKGLSRKKNRYLSNSFVCEGIKLIEEALNSTFDLEYIIFTDNLLSNENAKGLYERIADFPNLIYVNENIYKEISNIDNPEGIMAIVKFDVKKADILLEQGQGFYLLLDNLQDPGNMGTIIRSADAFNINGIIIGNGCVDPYNSKVIRSTMGSIFRLPLYFTDDSLEFIKKYKEVGFDVITTSLEGNINSYDINYSSNCVIIIGNESKGVSDEIMLYANKLIKIPMMGGAESLNAGVAASIIMYESMKQRFML